MYKASQLLFPPHRSSVYKLVKGLCSFGIFFPTNSVCFILRRQKDQEAACRCPSGEGDAALCTLPSRSVDLDKPQNISVGVELSITSGSPVKIRAVGARSAFFPELTCLIRAVAVSEIEFEECVSVLEAFVKESIFPL